MDKCIKDGQIPCRWVPDMGYGYGYPQFNFYAPFPYYSMEIFHLLGLGFLDSIKVVFALSVLVSTFGMFLLGKSLWGNTGGLISALLYAYAPYRAVDMYVRGAVGEFWALAFLPLILWSCREVLKNNRKAVLWLALSLAGLLTSHSITSLIFIPVFFVWVAFQFFLLGKELKNIVLSSFWGFSMAAFFLVPAWFERGFVHIQTLLQGYFNYLAHFVSIKQLLFSTYWDYGTSKLGPYDDISFAVGLLHWILPMLAVFLFIITKKKKQLLTLLFFVAIGWLALFMTHQKSVFIWNKITILSYLQFPWRFLTVAICCFSAASGSIALLFPKNKKFIFSTLAGISVFILILYSNYFRPIKWLEITDNEKLSGELWEKQLTISIFDYLPIYAESPPGEKAPDKPLIIKGDGKTISGQTGSNWQNWKVRMDEEGRIRLPLFYFPGWKVWVNGQKTAIDHDNKLGLITVRVTEGEQQILAKLESTPIRKLGNMITLAGFLTIPVFLREGGKKK